MARNTIRCEASDETELGMEMTDLIELANENGVPREEIKRILERHVNYVESERGRDELDGFDEMEVQF
jgi:glutamate synthase domain-containing protein 3